MASHGAVLVFLAAAFLLVPARVPVFLVVVVVVVSCAAVSLVTSTVSAPAPKPCSITRGCTSQAMWARFVPVPT